jgi:hypothetical protein
MSILAWISRLLSPYFLFPLGIFAIASLLLIIIIYLIRPKVKTHKLPSMIFLLNKKSKKKRYKWLKLLPLNWMLYLHLLIAVMLTLAILNPFILTPESRTKNNAIHVIDVSASMSAGGRFAAVQSLIPKHLSQRNTVIIVGSSPYVALQDAPARKTLQFVSTLVPQDTTTPLVSALLLASTVAKQDSAIHIYSDMIDTTSMSGQLTRAIAQLESNNNVVILHPIQKGTKNVGIIDASFNEKNISLLIKNYNDFAVDIAITDGIARVEETLPPNEIAEVSFTTPKIPTAIKLEYNDDFPNDNTFYFASLPEVKFPLLYISNDKDKYMTTALSLFDFISTTEYNPPGVSNAEKYDAFIFENTEINKVLPGTIKKALSRVEKGGLLVVKMSDMVKDIDLQGALPVKDIQSKKLTKIYMTNAEMVKGLTAASEEIVFTATPKEDTTVLLATSDDKAAVVMSDYGDGKIIYYGIDDNYFKSQFKLTYAFPILFKRALERSLHYPSLQQINKKTGVIQGGSGLITLPTRIKASLPIMLAESGFYKSGPMILAANLLDAKESDITTQTIDMNNNEEINILTQEQVVPTGLSWVFVSIALLLIFFEMIVLKWRRDL